MPATDFEALYDQATELVKAFPEYQFKTVTAMLVIIGWLVSSETAQAFVRSHADAALPWGMAAFGMLAVLKVIWIHGHYRRVSGAYARLLALAPGHGLSADALAQLRIGKFLPVSYVAVNTVLCVAGAVVLWLICH